MEHTKTQGKTIDKKIRENHRYIDMIVKSIQSIIKRN